MREGERERERREQERRKENKGQSSVSCLRIGEASLAKRTKTEDPSRALQEIQAVVSDRKLQMKQGEIHSYRRQMCK